MNIEKSTKQKRAQPNKKTAESRENFSVKQGRSVGSWWCTHENKFVSKRRRRLQLGGSGGMFPQKILKFRVLEMPSPGNLFWKSNHAKWLFTTFPVISSQVDLRKSRHALSKIICQIGKLCSLLYLVTVWHSLFFRIYRSRRHVRQWRVSIVFAHFSACWFSCLNFHIERKLIDREVLNCFQRLSSETKTRQIVLH